MPATSVSIFEPKTSTTVRLTYQVSLRDADGKPVAGEVVLKLEGDGSLSPAYSSKEIKRELDDSGTASLTWYRRGIYHRDVKATLSVEPPQADQTVMLELDPEGSANEVPWVSWVPNRFGH
jgi:hypothetical protein